MNDLNILDNDSSQNGLIITPAGRHGLDTAATWSKFLSILGFIMAGLMVLASIVMIVFAGAMGDAGLPFPFWILPVFYLAMTAVMVIIYLSLYRFADKSKSALASGNASELETALVNLGKFFKIVGIISIVFLVLYLVAMMSFGSIMTMFSPEGF